VGGVTTGVVVGVVTGGVVVGVVGGTVVGGVGVVHLPDNWIVPEAWTM
jgi:hypothetical protein